MFLNSIKFKGQTVVIFLTSEECFSPYNPVYKKIQETLVELGYKPECNHVFNGVLGNLHFSHTEVNMYVPTANILELEQIKSSRLHIDDTRKIVRHLEYIFMTNVSANDVGKVLK